MHLFKHVPHGRPLVSKVVEQVLLRVFGQLALRPQRNQVYSIELWLTLDNREDHLGVTKVLSEVMDLLFVLQDLSVLRAFLFR